jgi:ABC-type multidrug transport system fused ATPase/permease subunit
MKKVLSILAVLVFTLNLSFANYSSNQTSKSANTSETVKISNIINTENFSQKVSDFKDNLKDLKTKISQKVKNAKGNIADKIKESNLSISKYIIIGLVCLLLGAIVMAIQGLWTIGWIIAVIGLVLIILGLITYL